MNKKSRYEYLSWLIINLLVPLITPFVIAWSLSLIVHINMDVCELFIFLLNKGVYNFLGMFLLFSLFQNYSVARKAFGIIFWIFEFVFVWLQGLIFLTSLGLIEADQAITFEENMGAFIGVTVSSLAFSLLYKFLILKEKYKRYKN